MFKHEAARHTARRKKRTTQHFKISAGEDSSECADHSFVDRIVAHDEGHCPFREFASNHQADNYPCAEQSDTGSVDSHDVFAKDTAEDGGENSASCESICQEWDEAVKHSSADHFTPARDTGLENSRLQRFSTMLSSGRKNTA